MARWPWWKAISSAWVVGIAFCFLLGMGGLVTAMTATSGRVPELNVVASTSSIAGVNQTFDLPAGNYTLFWRTTAPDHDVAYTWVVNFDVRDASGNQRAGGSDTWRDERSCDVDSDGDRSCTGPAIRVLARFSLEQGTYRLQITVLQWTTSDANPPQAARTHFANPDAFEGRNTAAAVASTMFMFAWLPFLSIHLVGHRRDWQETRQGAAPAGASQAEGEPTDSTPAVAARPRVVPRIVEPEIGPDEAAPTREEHP